MHEILQGETRSFRPPTVRKKMADDLVDDGSDVLVGDETEALIEDGVALGDAARWFEFDPTPIVVVGQDGGVLGSNPAGRRMLQAQEIARLVSGRLTFAHLGARRGFEASLEKLAGEGNEHASAILRCDDGFWRRIDLMRCLKPVGAAFAIIRSAPRNPPDVSAVATAFRLTPAECRVLALLADGVSTKRIAAQLGISPNTVRAHLRSLYGKTNVRGICDLVREYTRLTT